MDSWVIWNLTGGVNGGRHVTDVTNASRTLLMNLRTLDWDERICESIGVPAAMLPEIRSSAEVYGQITGGDLGELLDGVPVASALGDQQAALFGQTCFAEGEGKSTYGTGTFLLMNTGEKIINSYSGLITTVGYRIGDQKPVYALEGSIAVTGSLVQWMRDQMGLISTAAEIEPLAASVEDNGGAYFVPAFSGLFAPYWRSDARGVLAGLTRYVTKAHLARAVLEATAWQTREITDAMAKDSGVQLATLRVDGGMTGNDLLMQILSDCLDAPVVRPEVSETTCLGAAYAAGLAVGFWRSVDELRANWRQDAEWTPRMAPEDRDREYRNWLKAVRRTMDWVEE
jgi:glycerol kinase